MSDPGNMGGPSGVSAEAPESDALPVLADAATVVRAFPDRTGLAPARGAALAAIPAVQAAAMAAGGFVAGAAVVGLAHRRSANSARSSAGRPGRGGRRLGRGGRRSRASDRAVELVQIVGSRSLLVDVHLLGTPGARPGR